MRTCSVKRPCIDRIYNVPVVIQVQPTPQRGTGVGKERGSLEGENLRDRDRGGSPSPCSLWLSPANNSTKRTDLYSEPEKCYPTKRTIPLASLVKGEVLSPEKIRATTGGIATPTLTPKN